MTAPTASRRTRPLAAIDIGTNSIRLLVATSEVDALRLHPVLDRTVTARLGQGVEATGLLDRERLLRVVTTVEEFRQAAAVHGAAPIIVAGTSAVRDAANGAELRDRIARTSGLTMAIIDGKREAELTFVGATAGHSLEGTILVADLGGGSLELVVARDGAMLARRSLQLGSGRLAERYLTTDPPDLAAIAAVEHETRQMLAPLVAGCPPLDRCLIAGGTAESLPILTPKPDGNMSLTLRRLNGAVAMLIASPSAQLARETGLDPERVRTLPAGAAIIGAILSSFSLDTAEVTRGGLREGLILDYLRYLKRLGKL